MKSGCEQSAKNGLGAAIDNAGDQPVGFEGDDLLHRPEKAVHEQA